MPDRSGACDISIIVPAYRAEGTLPECVASLLDLDFEGEFEVIVSASADSPQLLPRLPSDPRLTLLTHAPRLTAARARNRAAAVARGVALAFTDADTVVEPHWLTQLASASRGRLCVAGAVVNGTPDSSVGTTEYLVQFLDLHRRRPPATAWHGATCNLLVPRELWDRHGPFPEDLDGGEDTYLTVRLQRAGRFVFCPRAVVVHHNRTSLRRMLANQVYAGRYSARLGRRSPYKLRPLVRFTILAPVACVGRVVSLGVRLAAWDAPMLRRAVRLAPLIGLALLAWGWGLLTEGARIDAARRAARVRAARTPRPPARQGRPAS